MTYPPKLIPIRPSVEDIKRFYQKIRKAENGCWIWEAAQSKRGYGNASCGGRIVLAHRASWVIHNGPIPNELCVLHDCPSGDNPSCVNPAHLFLGTQQDNTADRVRKGRQAKGDKSGARMHPEKLPRGINNWRARINDAIVKEIRERAGAGEPQRLIALSIGIHHSQINKIVRRRAWAHVP